MKLGSLATSIVEFTDMSTIQKLESKVSTLLLTALFALGISACSEQTPSRAETLTYVTVGPSLDRSYRVSNLYVSNGNAFLPIAGRTDGPLRYAQLSIGGETGSPYKIVDLLIPKDSSYKLVGPMFVDTNTERMYAPVVITDGPTNTYTWLPYDSKGLTPLGAPIGSYKVPSNPELQFGVLTPGFYKDVIYPNYAGTLIGISIINGQQVYQKSGLLAPTQTNYAVIQNQILTFSRDSKSMLLIDMTSGLQKNLGESIALLSDKGYQATPFFTVLHGVVHLLAVSPGFKLGLCTITLQSTQGWQCKTSDIPLPNGTQIAAFNADIGTSTLYFLTNNPINGTQLNRIVQ